MTIPADLNLRKRLIDQHVKLPRRKSRRILILSASQCLMQVTNTNNYFREILSEVFRHTFGQRGHQTRSRFRPLATLLQQVIDLSFNRLNNFRSIKPVGLMICSQLSTPSSIHTVRASRYVNCRSDPSQSRLSDDCPMLMAIESHTRQCARATDHLRTFHALVVSIDETKQ